MRHGQGKFVHANGEIDEGVWDKGEMVTPAGGEVARHHHHHHYDDRVVL